ncbi:hypothetical protein Tco_0987466 [Tanacetum coccineum]
MDDTSLYLQLSDPTLLTTEACLGVIKHTQNLQSNFGGLSEETELRSITLGDLSIEAYFSEGRILQLTILASRRLPCACRRCLLNMSFFLPGLQGTVAAPQELQEFDPKRTLSNLPSTIDPISLKTLKANRSYFSVTRCLLPDL